MTFAAFVWDARFLTGIRTIDEQHQRLVELINRLGEVLVGDNAAALPEIVAGIRAYANYHFRSEEGIWESAGLDSEAQVRHREKHHNYVAQIDHLQSDLAGQPGERTGLLHAYLSSWLIFHILGEDHEMARRVLAGSPEQPVVEAPAAVPATLPTSPTSPTSPALPNSAESILLGALQNLYATLTTMNMQLRETNRGLDARVRERTQALEAANAALVDERDRLAAAHFQLDETRSRLLESEKLAAIGQLAAGIAHEINTPVGFVNSNLGTLGEYLNDAFAMLDTYAALEPLIARDPQAIAAVRSAKAEREIAFVREDARSLLNESRAGLARVRNIVHDLRTFSHVDQAVWSRVDLRSSLENTVNIVWHELRHRAELRREFGDTPPVLCNASQIDQVFMNLLTNATQAIDGHGIITVRSGAAQGEVWVEIEDNGCGIPPEHRARIFDPFFTTKPVGKGTGLGLSLAWSIVQSHAGRIEVDSTPGKGTRFRVWLPENGPSTPAMRSEA